MSEDRRLLPPGFADPAADIFRRGFWSEDFEPLRPGFESWRPRRALIDVGNLCGLLEKRAEEYEPIPADAKVTALDETPFTLPKGSKDAPERRSPELRRGSFAPSPDAPCPARCHSAPRQSVQRRATTRGSTSSTNFACCSPVRRPPLAGLQ